MTAAMRIARLEIRSLDIPFKVSFSHSAAERNRTQAVLVTATSTDGVTGYGEGCPREYVTGESIETARRFFLAHRREVGDLSDLEAVRDWVQAHREVIDANPAAWCAMEMALLDLIGKTSRLPFEALLGKPVLEGKFHYTAVLGMDNARVFEKQLGAYLDQGFEDFKVKLGADIEANGEKVKRLKAALGEACRIRFDANNGWRDTDAVIDQLASLDCDFWAVEEPFVVNDYENAARLARALGVSIILDESFQRLAQLAQIADSKEHWVINLRVSKMGGLLRSLELVDACRNLGIRLIVGAQVGETSLLTRAGLLVAHGARNLLEAQEGAFGTHLLEHDLCEPPLMFDAGGWLDTSSLPFTGNPGCGLQVRID